MEGKRSGLFANSNDWLYLGLALFFVLTIAFLLPITPNDYWWYVRVGRDTLQSGAVPTVDALTYTQAGTPVVYHSWLSALLFWLLYRAGGIPLTVLVRGIILALTYALIWRLARRVGGGPRLASLLTLLAALASSNNWSMRPQIYAYPLFALALWVLYGWERGKTKTVWLLPLISLLWVNLHGSFVMLFLLAGAALLFGRGNRKALALALGVSLALTLVNPRGFGAWTYVVASLSAPSSQKFSVEWRPPVNAGWQMNLFFVWLLAFPLLAAFSRRKLSGLEWVWFLGFGLLALWGERYGIWFILILTILTASLLAEWSQRWLDRPRRAGLPALDLWLAILFVAMPLCVLPGVREGWWAQAPSPLENTPVQAAEWLAQHPELPGPLWSEIGFSSYLEFALPSRPTWNDTRFEVFPEEQWEQYRAINSGEWNWGALLNAAGINLLMVSKAQQPHLLVALENSPAWCPVYRDEVAVIYHRKMNAFCRRPNGGGQ
ncbi:MAG: hypothetical protein Q7T47_02980 [Anaerolineales bacterium]|nr:hypothetical protein [Anaerolineales bacterium]